MQDSKKGQSASCKSASYNEGTEQNLVAYWVEFLRLGGSSSGNSKVEILTLQDEILHGFCSTYSVELAGLLPRAKSSALVAAVR